MKKTTFVWMSVEKDGLPATSDEYLCITEGGWFGVTDYSAKHKAFNTTDDTTPESVKKYGWTDVLLYAAIPDDVRRTRNEIFVKWYEQDKQKRLNAAKRGSKK